MTWGRGTCGQLGHEELSNCLLPKPVKFLEGFTISYVAAGWNHSGFVTDTGRLFMCGDGSFGQLGNGDHQSHGSPIEVLFFASKHIEQIACGMRHSLALVTGSSGSLVYGFGSGRHGQIGMFESETQKSHNFPKVIEGFENCEVVGIYANGDRSAALSADGQLYVWGRRFSGGSDNHIPQILPSPLRITQVALGWNHGLVLTDNGVYMFGGSRHGMLSGSAQVKQAWVPSAQGIILDAPTLEKVPCLDDEKVVHIAAGAEHSALITEKGTIMTWGWGEHGQLGLGNTCDQICPKIVNIDFKGSSASARLGIYCGSGFTIVVKVD